MCPQYLNILGFEEPVNPNNKKAKNKKLITMGRQNQQKNRIKNPGEKTTKLRFFSRTSIKMNIP